MKIKKPAAHKLSFRLWQWDLRLPGIGLFLISTLFFIYYSLQYSLHCHERVGLSLEQCKLVKRLPILFTSHVNLGTLKYAYVRSYPSHDKIIGVIHNIMLESDEGITPLLRWPTPGQYKKERVAQLISHFIKYSHKLTYDIPNIQSDSLYYLLLSLMLFGLLMVIRVNVIDVLIDKHRNIIRIDWHNLFSKTHRTIDTGLLKTIDVESTLTKNGKRRYRLAFILKDREIIPFTRQYSYFFFTKRNIAIKLNRFLGILNIISKGESVGTKTSHILHVLLISILILTCLIVFFSL